MDRLFATYRLRSIPIPKGLQNVETAYQVKDPVTGAGFSQGDVIGCGPLSPPPLVFNRLIVVHAGLVAMLLHAHGLHLGGFAAVAIVRLIIKV